MKHRIAILLLLLAIVLALSVSVNITEQVIIVSAVLLLFMVFLTIGITTMKWNYFMTSVNRAGQNKICLTFDDGPHEHTNAILDVLKKHGITACFFVIGKNCKAQADTLLRIKSEGHIIGNHSFSHVNSLGWASTKKISAEIEETNRIIHEITGQRTKWYRPPFGITNPNIARAVKSTHMKSAGWSIRSFDTVISDTKRLIERTKARINAKGHILLMHDTCEHTATALEEIILDCKEKGIRFVSLNDADFNQAAD